MTEQRWTSAPPPGYAPPRYVPQQGYGYRYPPPPPPVAPNGARLAEFSDRVLAFIIDYAILVSVTLILTIPVIIYQLRVMTDWAEKVAERPPPEDSIS